MAGPYLPMGFDSGLEDLLCDPSLLYGPEMTAFACEDDSLSWDGCSPHESASSGGAKLQSHHASAGGSSRSPTGSSLIFTPTSTQLDYQDVDGFLEPYMDGSSTSPESNINSVDDYVHVHVHSFDAASNAGIQRISSRPARNSHIGPGSLCPSESPHPHNASLVLGQRRQPPFMMAYSNDIDDSLTERQFLSGAQVEPYQGTDRVLLSEAGEFDAPLAAPSYIGEGLPFRTAHNSEAPGTSFGNMAMLSQQMTHLPATTHNMMGFVDNNGFAHYPVAGGVFTPSIPQTYRAGLTARDASHMQYLQSISQNAALPHSGPCAPTVVQPKHLSNNPTAMYAADAVYQQHSAQAAAEARQTSSTNARRLDADKLQVLQSLSKRSTIPSGSSHRSGGLHAHDHADRVRKGGRSKNSKLTDKSREQSSAMRKLGACWRCAMQRDSCDHGDPCQRCSTTRSQRSQAYFFPCDRSKLPDFVHEFLPPSMTIMHQKQTIEDSVASTVLDWDYNNGIDIYLSSGYGPPLLWKVYEFRPRGKEYLTQLQYRQDNDRDQMVRTVNYSPPYGLLKIEPTEEVHMNAYLDRLLEQRFLWDFGWTFYEAESPVDDFQAGALDLICKLYINTIDEVLASLLKDILRMLLITYIMGHTLTISEETVPTVIANIRHSPTPGNYNQKYTSPKLANRQLKFFFAVLRNGIYEKLLKWQQQTLHTAGGKEQTWLRAFCVTLGFAMVLEEVQHTLFIQADASVARNDMNREAADQQASNACERIDTRFKLLVGLFQCKYRDKKWGDNGSFGPGTPQVKDPASRMFLAELRENLAERRDHLQSRENVTFSQENQCYFTSRLTAKFLVPFLDLPG